ncbi:hypothetical protein FBU59_001046 [Linderina macrospora]|uniref:Uncharacterized protein n=1 Tax=Linderina macrospora TaxID=4868 RepID=A0ACC1JFF1_9FUNG|nr:hypothetical protein FBU59_001046 [Linderina macrospora]
MRVPVPGDDGSFNPQSPTFTWLSNIKDIIKARQEDKVRRLQVIMRHGYQCPLGLLEELERLGFANRVWTSVRELEVHGLGFLACDTNLPDEEQATVVTRGRQFFRQHLPSIQSLKYRRMPDEWATLNERGNPAFLPFLLFSALQFEYIGQATAIELVQPFPDQDYPPVNESVEHLRIHFDVLDPVIPVHVPQLPTRNLKTLIIDEISRSIPF